MFKRQAAKLRGAQLGQAHHRKALRACTRRTDPVDKGQPARKAWQKAHWHKAFVVNPAELAGA